MELQSEKIKNLPIHLILCTERTGSSMLSAMLNISDEVICSSEELFAIYFFKKYQNKTRWTEKDVFKFTQELEIMLENSPELFFTDREKLYKSLVCHIDQLNYSLLIRITYLHFIDIKNKSKVKIIIDKQIKFWYHLNLVKSIFPSSKIILLTRDIRDNVLSKSKRKINNSDDNYLHAYTWNSVYKKTKKLKELYPENLQIVHYEKLVSNPEVTLKSICKFLEIKFNPEMLKFNLYFEQFLTSKEERFSPEKLKEIKEFHENMFFDVNSNQMGNWEKSWDKETSMKISYIGQETGGQLGYDFSIPYGVKYPNLFNYFSFWKSFFKTDVLFKLYFALPLSAKIGIKKIRKKFNLLNK